MKKIVKIITGIGVGVVGALGVGIPLIVIESNKSGSNIKSQINLSEIKTDSVKFSIPFSFLKTVPTNKQNEKAKITLKNGENEIILENNFSIDKNEVNFTLSDLNPGTEYRIVKVEFADNSQVDLLPLNTIFKTEPSLNQSPQESPQEAPQEEKPKNPGDSGDSGENNEKKDENIKPENPNNPIETGKGDDSKIGGNEKPNDADSPKNDNRINDNEKTDSENIVKKNADSIKFSYWKLESFSPNSKSASSAARFSTVESVISQTNPDLILLSGMSPTSGENMDRLISNLNKRIPDSNWGHVSSPRSSKNSQQRRYTFLYKKSLLELIDSDFSQANTVNDFISQGFSSVNFKTNDGKKLNLGTVVTKAKSKNSKKSRRKKVRTRKGQSDQGNQEENSDSSQSDQSKFQVENLKQEIEKRFKDGSFIFAGTFQVGGETDSNNSFSSTLSSYNTLLAPNSKTTGSKKSNSSFLITSKNTKTLEDAKIEDISSILGGNSGASVSASYPISVTVSLKN